MSEDIKEAINSLEKWVISSSEKNKKPKKIEYSSTFFTDDGIKCITMKFKMGLFGDWLLGISSDAGTMSEMKPFNKDTEVEEAKQMILKLKNIWNDVSKMEVTEDKDDNFLNNIK